MIKFSKLNNRGFMLAEVVITSSVIAATLVTLFITLSKVRSSYERRDRYYDLDAQQIAIEASKVSTSEYGSIISLVDDYNLFDSIKINRYNKNSLVVSLPEGASQSYIDYIAYLNDAIDVTETGYTDIIVVELLKQDINYYYYALKVKE